MTLYPWLFVIPAAAAVAIVLYSLAQANSKRKKRKSRHHVTSIAHTSAIRNLPEYQKARKRYTMLVILAGFFLLLSLASSTIVASRPVSVDLVAAEYDNRDIMLCLDVSGSMNSYFDKMVTRLREIVSEMKGERFGITIFDGTPITVVPLSNDYDTIDKILEDNERGYTDSNGRHRTLYECTQVQRRYEREIRKAKEKYLLGKLYKTYLIFYTYFKA